MLFTAIDTPPRTLAIGGGKVLRPSIVFNSYFRFACARQDIFLRRLQGQTPPWTDDPVLGAYRFTNVYRASDRVSQYLIREVLYRGEQQPEEIFFRALLFKIFNRIETWIALQESVGFPQWRDYRFEQYASVLDGLLANGQTIYSGAYIMPSPRLGDVRKHRNHLRLLELMMRDRLADRIAAAKSLEAVFHALSEYPSLGRFLAFQFAIDLNYSTLSDHSEMDFVVSGPGASDGIRKCFSERGGLSDEDIIRVVAERADDEFKMLGLRFTDLWGRSLQLIDCQNLFCEIDKYARVVHPEYAGTSGRTRIKRRFQATQRVLPQWYPPKWGIAPPKPSV